MLKRILILLTLALTQVGCSVEEGVGPYTLTPLTSEAREELEGLKRDFLKIEDIRLGNGPIASWNHRLEADVEVRYIDGTVAYRGDIWINIGFDSAGFLHKATDALKPSIMGNPAFGWA
jgi:hypothetical protein